MGVGLSRYTTQKRIEKPTANLLRTEFEAKLSELQITKAPVTTTCARAGTVPAAMRNLTNLELLQLSGNDLQKPNGCPTDSDGDMVYYGKEEVAAFLRCL